MTNKKRLILLTVSVAAIVILAILYFIIQSFLLSVFLHIILRFLCVLLILTMIQKCFKEQLTQSMKKALVFCGIALTLDLVVIDAIRWILRDGVSTILFLPVCLPICFMVILYFSAKDTGKGSREKVITFLIGIPLSLFAVYIEILSFIQR